MTHILVPRLQASVPPVRKPYYPATDRCGEPGNGAATVRKRNGGCAVAKLQRVVPCLWFDTEAEEAATFYTSIFDNARIVRVTRFAEAGQEIHGKPAGSVMAVVFTLDGQEFMALNGGPQFKFTEAVSFQVFCETQEEIDYYWSRLTADGGQEGPCGWLKDRFGLSWQVVPRAMEEGWLVDPDPARVQRVLEVLYTMEGKLEIEPLRRAYYGE